MDNTERDAESLLNEYNEMIERKQISRGFMFYANYFDSVMEIKDNMKRYLALKAIIEYGLYGEFPDNILDPEIQIMMKYIIPNIDNTKINYMFKIINSPSYKKKMERNSRQRIIVPEFDNENEHIFD